MLETLIPSRIRRSLLEHIVSHPNDRFYLRGLAKELGLTVSPVRRELKRLEHLGVLKTYQEANIRFYVVDQHSPLFVHLKQATLAGVPVSSSPAQAIQQPAPLISSTVLSAPTIDRIRRALRPRLSLPTLVSALSLGLVVVLGLGVVIYIGFTNQRLLSLANQAISAPRSQITVVESDLPASLHSAQAGPNASGEMRSSRWRLMPGAFGGFSQGASEETY